MAAPGLPDPAAEVVASPLPGSTGPSAAPAEELLRSGRSRSSPPLQPRSAHTATSLVDRPRLQSIVVCDAKASVNASEETSFPPWEVVLPRRGRHGRSPPLPAGQRPTPPASPARAAFLRRFRGRCLRCLSKNHRRADCRDPVRCIDCWAWGHTAGVRCPLSRRRPSPKGPVHSPLRLRSWIGSSPPSRHHRFPQHGAAGLQPA
jgi:hypothetical protein